MDEAHTTLQNLEKGKKRAVAEQDIDFDMSDIDESESEDQVKAKKRKAAEVRREKET